MSAAPAEEAISYREALREGLMQSAQITAHKVVERIKGVDLAGTVCRHAWHGKGYDFDVRLLQGDFVTADAGTGFVHIAPGHGADDYELGIANGGAVKLTTVAGSLTATAKVTERLQPGLLFAPTHFPEFPVSGLLAGNAATVAVKVEKG